MTTIPKNALQRQLDQITANTRALVPPERLARTEETIADLLASGIETHTLAVGSPAPDFSLTAGNGKRVRSADLLALGPVVVKFFRGRWCPYDITELEAWQALLPELRTAHPRGHALFVAVSPQTPRQNAFTAQPHGSTEGFTFPVLSDPGAEIATRFGLAYTVPEPVRAWYRSMLVNIPMLYGNDTWRLPLPAVFVLRQDGTVAFAEAHADHRVRANPEAVLQAVRDLE